MAFLNCNRDSLSALKEVDLKVGRHGGAWERESGCLPKPDTAQIVSPHAKLSGNHSLTLSHTSLTLSYFLLKLSLQMSLVKTHNCFWLGSWFLGLKQWSYSKAQEGEKKRKRERPGNSDVLKHTMCEFVWCGMICLRRPNSLYDGHAKLVDTGLCSYVRVLHQSKPDQTQPVRPCLDPAGLSILK